MIMKMKSIKFSLLGILSSFLVFTACEDDFTEEDLLRLQAELAETASANDHARTLDVIAQQHANLLVIADGTDSPLRQQLGIAVKSADYHQFALIANVALDRDHKHVAYERFTDEGPIALLPLQPLNNTHRAALVWTFPATQAKIIATMDSDTLRHQLQSRFGFRVGRILKLGAHRIYPLTTNIAQEQVRSHLAIVGNAAHSFHPAAGQGFNLAMRDCLALATCLAAAIKNKHNASENTELGNYATMKQYWQQQQIDQTLTMTMTNTLVSLFSSKKLSFSIVRQLGLLGLTLVPTARKLFTKKMMGTLVL